MVPAVYDDMASHNAKVGFAVQLLFVPYPVEIGDLLVRVRKKRELQTMLGPQLLESLRRVGADADDRPVGGRDSLEFITESDSLVRSTFGHGLWEEVENHALSAEARNADPLAVVRGQLKVLGLVQPML